MFLACTILSRCAIPTESTTEVHVARKPKDPFSAFRPKKEEVPVGSNIFILQTATLDQESRFLAVIERLDIDKLFGPLGQLMGGVFDDGDVGISGSLKVIPKIAEIGPQIWSAAQTVLGQQFAPAMRDAAVALLDTRTNRDMLESAELIGGQSAEPDLGSSGEYLGCPGVRSFVADNLTMLQAVYVVKSAWSINGYGEIVGNLIPLMMTEAEPQGTTPAAR